MRKADEYIYFVDYGDGEATCFYNLTSLKHYLEEEYTEDFRIRDCNVYRVKNNPLDLKYKIVIEGVEE